MSTLAVEGLRAERDATLTIAKSFTDADWNAPSDCDGWAVRDVIAEGRTVTSDLGGTTGTAGFADAIISRLAAAPAAR